jgi:hypothetical protein
VLGGPAGVELVRDESDRGLVEVAVEGDSRDAVTIGGVRFVFKSSEESPL